MSDNWHCDFIEWPIIKPSNYKINSLHEVNFQLRESSLYSVCGGQFWLFFIWYIFFLKNAFWNLGKQSTTIIEMGNTSAPEAEVDATGASTLVFLTACCVIHIN